MMKSSSYMTIFKNEELFIKTLDWGFIPSLNFIDKTNLLNNPNLADKILDTIELTSKTVNSRIFYNNANARKKSKSK